MLYMFLIQPLGCNIINKVERAVPIWQQWASKC